MIKKRSTKIFLAGLAIFGAMAAVGYGYMYYQLSQVKHVDLPQNDEELGIGNKKEVQEANTENQNNEEPAATEEPSAEAAAEPDPETVNIALFGLDRRDASERGRSDSIIILSIDYEHNKIKLSSIMRDTYVYVAGHGNTKINHAYAYEGPVLAIKTLNSNFDLNIKEFVAVDFEGFKKIIDVLGGVEIEIKSYELPTMETVGIYEAGTYNLSGEQALAYSRIRHQGNGDYERTDRQRRVLEALFQKIKGGGIIKFPVLVSSLVPYTETSLETDEILNLGTSVFTHSIASLDQVRFPLDSVSEEKTINGVWYLVTDLETTGEQINEFIYDDINPSE
ncbi:MAG: cell envelope-related transcriptional attenuator domain protein [Firmicutes bacterium]|nr:cell envelope-related transcriptional attenuator domain protein [Bacillota bacterium]